VKRVLLTGMSGTGKSSVIQALSARGFKAVDTDDGWCEPLPDGRQRWREDAIGQLLDTEDAGVLFVAGCEENQVRFHRTGHCVRCWREHLVVSLCCLWLVPSLRRFIAGPFVPGATAHVHAAASSRSCVPPAGPPRRSPRPGHGPGLRSAAARQGYQLAAAR
jgi:hypothetical protein